ncbi:hypothetical protein ElyMa_003733500 [Elysia marginata]|uniref:Uncharacterized protein n=1 Tax=Elysia marginata TaxID=1093978 RepID=A0AAV4F720_9GAST|nr:hypothetical protein ElyMa_003733500 [Elysia marginata]
MAVIGGTSIFLCAHCSQWYSIDRERLAVAVCDRESNFYDFIESKRALGAALGNNSVKIIGTSKQVCFKSVYEVHTPPETSQQS